MTDTPRVQPESDKPDDTKPTLDADLEPSSAKDKAQDERLGIMVDDEQIIDTPDKSS